jgi:uncharacterized BrkB/YihY/UPF0761 family membrane protein
LLLLWIWISALTILVAAELDAAVRSRFRRPARSTIVVDSRADMGA